MPKPKTKKTTYRSAIMRLNRILRDLNIAVSNPDLYDATFDDLQEVATNNISYLKKIEKLLDKQMSQVASLLNNYEAVLKKVKTANPSKEWCGTCKD